jgi:ssDNA-binding Zn-finger/Zn-ribbon topoisomerase 1
VSDDQQRAPVGETCPVCGKDLVLGTTDFAGIPDETSDVDEQRAELNPGQMVRVAVCPDPDCPGPDAGAQV